MGINVSLNLPHLQSFPTQRKTSLKTLKKKKKKIIKLQTLHAVPWQDVPVCVSKRELVATLTASLWSLFCEAESVRGTCASKRGEHIIIILSVPVSHVRAYAARLHGHRGTWWCVQGGTAARGWQNAEGNTSHRDVPAHEVCKSDDGGRRRGRD